MSAMPDAADRHFQAAIVAFTEGNGEQAADHIRSAVTLDPQNARYQTTAAEVFRRGGRLAAAIDAGRHAISLAPISPAVHNNLGLALQDDGYMLEAERCFHRAIQLVPDYARARCNLGILLTRQYRRDEAAVSLQQALRLKLDYPPCRTTAISPSPKTRPHGPLVACPPTRSFIVRSTSLTRSPTIFDVWMNILLRVPRGVFWQRESDPHIQDNLRCAAKSRGIDPARLIFAPNVPDMEQHLARHRCADLFLDT